ncbi:hypothetical protein GCM10007939_13390 [Amylibacter marinus]|uniref:GlsB/YeaQ/YmgE family stress response membrane protein n=1 Tax=Amylibacter marinus TaxID=1475483 RepID=A0ABQ5VUH6_9RHOB|nr:GlsB/YeaQ/YmgE family stress response membrane protein [Amylibacter marinus]GLQ35056.1 hypothetical protein GCM10007939_13390 [Amylibacter marinus]
MPILLTIIVGAAAGMLVAYLLKLKVSPFVAIAIGVIGTILGMISLRGLMVLMAGASTVASLFVAALFGSAVLIILYRVLFRKDK